MKKNIDAIGIQCCIAIGLISPIDMMAGNFWPYYPCQSFSLMYCSKKILWVASYSRDVIYELPLGLKNINFCLITIPSAESDLWDERNSKAGMGPFK